MTKIHGEEERKKFRHDLLDSNLKEFPGKELPLWESVISERRPPPLHIFSPWISIRPPPHLKIIASPGSLRCEAGQCRRFRSARDGQKTSAYAVRRLRENGGGRRKSEPRGDISYPGPFISGIGRLQSRRLLTLFAFRSGRYLGVRHRGKDLRRSRSSNRNLHAGRKILCFSVGERPSARWRFLRMTNVPRRPGDGSCRRLGEPPVSGRSN